MSASGLTRRTSHGKSAAIPDYSSTAPPVTLPQQFLYFFPLPQGHGSLRPTLAAARTGFFTAGSLLAEEA